MWQPQRAPEGYELAPSVEPPGFDDDLGWPLMDAVPLFIGGVFVVIVGIIVVSLGRRGAEWHNNNQQPVLRVPATLANKRVDQQSRRYSRDDDSMFDDEVRTYSTYVLTFEEESTGRRHVFNVPQRTFDAFLEHDRGMLVRQGTRFHDFVLRPRGRHDGYRDDAA